METFEKVKSALIHNIDYDSFKDLIRGIHNTSLRVTDENHLNLLHHAILSQNSDCLRLLLMKGIFLESEQPDKYPYLHVASYMENSTIINILLQERPNDVLIKCKLDDIMEISVVLRKFLKQKSWVRPSSDPSNENSHEGSTKSLNSNNNGNFESLITEYSNKVIKFESITVEHSNHCLSPVDIAAFIGNLKCVELMLNSKALLVSSKISMLEQCVDIQSMYAVKILLENNVPSHEDIGKAFKKALMSKLAPFVDIILEHCSIRYDNNNHNSETSVDCKNKSEKDRSSNTDEIYANCKSTSEVGVEKLRSNQSQIKTILNGMNPYHVMYMYSSAFQIYGQKNRYGGLQETTHALLKHGFHINVKDPPGSFPLYSLLYSLVSECVQYPLSVPKHHFKTLKFLLENEAEIDYDESSIESEEISVGKKSDDIMFDIKRSTACGRGLYRSPVHAVIHEISVNHLVSQVQVDFIEECLEILFSFGAKMDDELLGESLTALAFQHSHGDFIDFSELFSILLQHGASPNMYKCLEPINIVPESSFVPLLKIHTPGLYFYEILRLSKEIGTLSLDRIKANHGIDQTLKVLKLMDYATAKEAIDEIEDLFKEELSGEIFEFIKPDSAYERFFYYVDRELVKFRENPDKLIFLCQKCVWNGIHRDQSKLQLLNIPTNLKRTVLQMFVM